jgi:Flp pilus assembly protein TadD
VSESLHNQLYTQACALIGGLIQLGGQPPPDLDAATRSRLEQAIPLFEQVLTLNPANWPAMWLLGKVHQRLGDFARSLECFTAAHRVCPDHPDVAREASIAAMDAGLPEQAVTFCERAIATNPADQGLRANLALALLFSGRPEQAAEVARDARKGAPSDAITARIVAVIDEVLSGVRPCPHHVRDLD